MTTRRRRRRIPRPDCSTILLCLAVLAAGVWVVVRSVVMWITGHPGAVTVLLVLAGLTGAGTYEVSTRRQRPSCRAVLARRVHGRDRRRRRR
jgi:hypothetical protein